MHGIRLNTRSLSSIRLAVGLSLALLAASCAAATPGADPSMPRAGAAPYPVTLLASEERLNASRDAWARLLSAQGVTTAPPPELQPVTATVRALPVAPDAPLRLPRIGDATREMTQEETRESLRRFLASAPTPLGARPEQLSLVEYEELDGDVRRAVYQQNPFSHPLRGGYGRVEVTFTRDLRITGLSSTAVPDTERLSTAIETATQERITAEQAVASLAGKTVTYTDAGGRQQTRNVGGQGEAAARELVILPVPSAGDPSALEFHLAWEIAVAGSPPLLVYIDAVSGVQVGASAGGAAE